MIIIYSSPHLLPDPRVSITKITQISRIEQFINLILTTTKKSNQNNSFPYNSLTEGASNKYHRRGAICIVKGTAVDDFTDNLSEWEFENDDSNYNNSKDSENLQEIHCSKSTNGPSDNLFKHFLRHLNFKKNVKHVKINDRTGQSFNY